MYISNRKQIRILFFFFFFSFFNLSHKCAAARIRHRPHARLSFSTLKNELERVHTTPICTGRGCCLDVIPNFFFLFFFKPFLNPSPHPNNGTLDPRSGRENLISNKHRLEIAPPCHIPRGIDRPACDARGSYIYNYIDDAH